MEMKEQTIGSGLAWTELRKLTEQTLPEQSLHMESWWLAVWPFRRTAAKILAEKIIKAQPGLAVRVAELVNLVIY